jgi:hypothetical protein
VHVGNLSLLDTNLNEFSRINFKDGCEKRLVSLHGGVMQKPAKTCKIAQTLQNQLLL